MTNSANHTPGPQKFLYALVDGSDEPDTFEVLTEDESERKNEEAKRATDGTWWWEKIGSLPLIAAAPDMAGALREVHDLIQQFRETGKAPLGNLTSWHDKARAALKKAGVE